MEAQHRIPVFALVLVALALVFSGSSAWSKTRYVEKWGDTANQPDCRRTAPCLNIQDTINNSNRNDKIVVGPGLYVEPLIIGVEGLKLESTAGRYGTTIIGDGSGFGHVIEIVPSRVQFGRKGKGFTVLGASSLGNAILVGLSFQPRSGIKIQGNRIGLVRRVTDDADSDYDNDGGISVFPSTDRIQITNNIIQNTAGTAIICASCNGALIRDNRISGNAGKGISIVTSVKAKILRNVITQNSDHGFEGRAGVTNLLIKDNVSDGNTDNGFDVGDGIGAKILSNIAVRNELSGFNLVNTATDSPSMKATKNLALGNFDDAIRLESINPTIDGNTLINNGDDGIDFHNTATTKSLKRNNIYRNFGCGIRGIDNFVVYDPVRHFFESNVGGDTCTGVTPDGTTVSRPGPLSVNRARSLVGG